MFGLFSKKQRHERLPDLVYLERSCADKALLENIRQEGAGNVSVIYFFDNTFHRLEKDLGGVRCIRAERILNDLSERAKVKTKSGQLIIFAEHYPLFTVEDAVIRELEELGGEDKLKIRFYTSLDEPMMKMFGSEKIAELMKRMGMKEEEPIAHSMVSKSIRHAQEKLSAKVPGEIKASSAEEWMRVNLPQ